MTKKTVNDSEVISIQFCGLNYVKIASQRSLFLFVCLFFRHDSDCSKVFFCLSFPIWLYKVSDKIKMFLSQERILSCLIIIVIFSLDHVKNYASVNSSCAQPPPPPTARADPRALPWMSNSRGWGLLSCQIPWGGDKNRGQMPRQFMV